MSSDEEVDVDAIIADFVAEEALVGVEESDVFYRRREEKRQRVQTGRTVNRSDRTAEASTSDSTAWPSDQHFYSNDFPAEDPTDFPDEEMDTDPGAALRELIETLERRVQELQQMTSRIGASAGGAKINLTEWQTKSKAQHEAWESIRPICHQIHVQCQAVPEPSLCCSCNEACAVVKCLDCKHEGLLLCGLCDDKLHPFAHFHRRRSFQNGFCEPLPPHFGFDEDGLVKIQGRES